jgi:alkylation response protein AidB-like acyl-CoA dehydrogenase
MAQDSTAPLREATEQLFGAIGGMTFLRKLFVQREGLGEAFYQRAADAGWFASLIDSAYGGGTLSDSALSDAVAISEARGRRCMPGAFISANVSSAAINRFASAEVKSAILPNAVAGTSLGAWTFLQPSAPPDLYVGLPARDCGDAYVVSASKCTFVIDAAAARWLLVVLSTSGGLAQCIVPTSSSGVRLCPLSALDPGAEIAEVTFRDVVVPKTAVISAGPSCERQLQWQFDLANLLTIADAVGAMRSAFDLTLVYAKERYAFGRPIGSFQAIKHQLADLSMAVLASRSALASAVELMTLSAPGASEVVSIAKSYVSEVATDVAQGAQQIHGGIGFAFEHDVHLYMRRLAHSSSAYGDAISHRERICRLRGL